MLLRAHPRAVNGLADLSQTSRAQRTEHVSARSESARFHAQLNNAAVYSANRERDSRRDRRRAWTTRLGAEIKRDAPDRIGDGSDDTREYPAYSAGDCTVGSLQSVDATAALWAGEASPAVVADVVSGFLSSDPLR
jgi:hypothetical protein